jgi:hypothetical protein
MPFIVILLLSIVCALGFAFLSLWIRESPDFSVEENNQVLIDLVCSEDETPCQDCIAGIYKKILDSGLHPLRIIRDVYLYRRALHKRIAKSKVLESEEWIICRENIEREFSKMLAITARATFEWAAGKFLSVHYLYGRKMLRHRKNILDDLLFIESIAKGKD